MPILRQIGKRENKTINLHYDGIVQIKDGIIEVGYKSRDYLLSQAGSLRYKCKWEEVEKIEDVKIAPSYSIAAYTCITNGKSMYRPFYYEGIDSYFFTDNLYEKRDVNAKPVPLEYSFMKDVLEAIKMLDPKDRASAKSLLISQKIKILAPTLGLLDKRYDYTIWHDGSIYVANSPDVLIGQISKTNDLLFAYSHSSLNGDIQRKCVFDEINFWEQIDKYYKIMRKKALDRYTDINFPKDYGLYGGAVVIQNHKTNEVEKYMLKWWEDIITTTFSDQLSLPYILWKYNVPFRSLGRQFSKEHNHYFLYKGHNA